MADLRGLEHDVGQALALQLEHAQLEELVDQAADAAVELRLVPRAFSSGALSI